MTVLIFVLGLGLLVLGAEWLVRGASNLALGLGTTPLVVGLTVVAFGTSAPELAVSVGAAFDGSADMAVGNVVGSNIFNVLFILGLSALLAPLVIERQVVRQELPVMLAVTGITLWLWSDGALGRGEGALLLGLLVAYTVALFVQARAASAGEAAPDPSPVDFAPAAPHVPPGARVGRQLALIGLGLVGLVLGARWVVEGATSFARILGVGEVAIGLTIVAAGTSLPEVATSVMAALRGQRDIAVGNVLGSNVFNLLGCLGASALVAPGGIVVPGEVLARDGWVMLAAAAVCVPVFWTGRRIARSEGALLLGGYIAYTVYLLGSARG